MTATSDERRDMARKLRELPIDMYEVEEKWESEGLNTDCHDQTDYYLIYFVLFGCFPAEHMNMGDYDHHRAVLFSVIVENFAARAWKSKLHADGTMYEGMFIVGIETPDGQATYHYDVEPYWNLFRCKEVDRAPEWDGHTPDQAIERIGKLVDCKTDRPTTSIGVNKHGRAYCTNCGCDDWCLASDGNARYCPNCGAKVMPCE